VKGNAGIFDKSQSALNELEDEEELKEQDQQS
jgi:hypothetical protein